MALVLADRVKETTTTTGTSDFALGGAVASFQTFSAGVGVNNTTYYAVADSTNWEVGLGTLSNDGLTLARTTVLQSSNSDAKVSFAAGSKEVFVTYAADKAVFEDASGNVTLPSNLTAVDATFTSLTVNDNATFGSSNSDTATFTGRIASEFTPSSNNTYDLGRTGHEWRNLYLTGTGNIDSLIADTADINGGTIDATAIGSTTPSSGAFTTVTASTPIGVASGGTGLSSLGTGVATFLGTPSSANLASAITDETGSGSLVFATSPTLVTPALGTPSALVGTNITGTAAGLTAGTVTTNANLTGAVTSVGNSTSLGSFTSANLLAALTDETGTGSAVFATSPTLVTPILGTPTSATLTNATGLPIATGVSGLGTGVATALAVNVGSSGAPLVNGGVLGTPSSGTVTNLTGTASININGTVGATTANTGAFTSLSSTIGSNFATTSGNIGLGVAVPTKDVEVSGELRVQASATGGTGAGIEAFVAGGISYFTAYNRTTSAYSPASIIGSTVTITGDTTVSGTLKNSATISVGNATPSASGAGITFPATQSASSDANTLDDYEEGTWTPSVGGTATYSSRTGTYTKIGRQVTAWFDVTILLIGTGGGSLSGLPFTNTSSLPGVGGIGYFSSLVSSFVIVNPIVPGSGVIVTFETATAAAATLGDNQNIWANSSRCLGFVTYHV